MGRAALFSSGWENVHGIKPLTRGQRWALSVPFYVHGLAPQLEGAGATAVAYRDGAPSGVGSSEGGDQGAWLVDSKAAQLTHAARFRANCVHPYDKHAYQACRQEWATSFD